MYTYITPEIYHSKNDGLGNVFAFKHGYFKEEGKYIHIDIKHPNKKKGQNPNPTFLFAGVDPLNICSQIDPEKKVPPTTPIVSISSPSGNSFAALRASPKTSPLFACNTAS